MKHVPDHGGRLFLNEPGGGAAYYTTHEGRGLGANKIMPRSIIQATRQHLIKLKSFWGICLSSAKSEVQVNLTRT